MLETILAILGLVIGGVIAWLWTSNRLRSAAALETADIQSNLAVAENTTRELRGQIGQHEKTITDLREQLIQERQKSVEAATRLQETAKQFQEQKALLNEAEKKLKDSFESLSAKALRTNAEQFLGSAKKTLDLILADARGDLGKRQEAINNLVKPIAESLKRYEDHIRQLEQTRQKAYGSLEEQLKTLTSASQQLQQETGKLVTSLRDPKVRGRWGEIALRRAAELAGMAEHCDFEQQVNQTGDDNNRYRPDMVVKLPNNRTVIVDAKAVLDAYLNAVAAHDEAERQQYLDRHATQIRSRIRELSAKSYWDKFDQTPEFVVLFLPAESFFSAAVEVDHTLIEDAIASRVVLASPTTLIALLKAIAYGWRQKKLDENAQQIRDLGEKLFDRMRILAEHFAKIGANLDRAVSSYNNAVGSLEVRVLPSARKFKELGAAGSNDIPTIEPIERTPRELNSSSFDAP